MAEPENMAINRMIARRAAAPTGGPGAKPMEAAPGRGAPGMEGKGADDPLQTAVNLMDAVVFRLGQVNPEAAEKLTAAIDGIKAVAGELRQGGKAEAPPPGGMGGKSPAPAPVPGGDRLPQ